VTNQITPRQGLEKGFFCVRSDEC